MIAEYFYRNNIGVGQKEEPEQVLTLWTHLEAAVKVFIKLYSPGCGGVISAYISIICWFQLDLMVQTFDRVTLPLLLARDHFLDH